MNEHRSSKRRRIAVLLNDFSGTGVPRVTLRLAGELEAQGCDVDILVLRPHGPMAQQVRNSVNIVPLGVSRASIALPKLICYLRKRDPDGLIAAEDQLGIIAAAACILSRRKAHLVVTSHVPYSRTGLCKGTKGKLFLIALRFFWSRINTFATVSAGLADDMAETTGISRTEISVIHNAVVDERSIGRAENKSIHPFFQTCSRVIVGAGSLHRRKGFHDLVEAVRLAAETEDIRLIILGEGRERAKLQAQISQAGLSDRVDLIGYVNDPFPYLQAADLFVLPSYFEGLPTVLIEALACGCPCVATDCIAGPNEILKGGKLGALVRVGDPIGLANAVLATLRNPVEKEVLFNRAADFSAENIAKQFFRVIPSSRKGSNT